VGDFQRWLISLMMDKKNSDQMGLGRRNPRFFGGCSDGITAGNSQQ
jgi:hypothetical protein